MPRVSAEYLEHRRRHILDAALSCFATEGFHQTTMRHIVRAAGLSAGAIYKYFASKDEIVAAIAAQRRAAERQALREAVGADDAREGLLRLTRAVLGRLSSADERRWRRVTVQLWAEALRNTRVKALVLAGLQAPLRDLSAVIRRAQAEGRVAPNVQPEASARVAVAVFQGLVLQQAWEPKLDVAACLHSADALLAALIDARKAPRPSKQRASRSRRPASR